MEKKNQLKSCCKNSLSSPNTHHSSSRPCGRQERGIGAAHTLYPAFAARRVGMTERVCRVARMANHGFTLIELLVVVLIIGILAAVAFPQYEQSVMRSRFATLKANATAIYKAQQVYYMANGEYATDLEALSIELTGCTLSSNKKDCVFSWGKCVMLAGNDGDSGRVACYNTQNMKNGYAWYWNSPYYGPEACWALSSDTTDKYHKLCEREGGHNLLETICGAAPLDVCHIYKLGAQN